MAGGGQSHFLDALGRSESKKGSGFKNWNVESTDESDGDVEKDDVNLLSLEENDGPISELREHKPRQFRPGTGRTTGDIIRTYERKVKHLHLRPVRGNATGLNMLGGSKKLGDGVQSIAPASGTFVQGRLFHHTNITRTVVKTAAQSLERRERKEYPPHVQKVEVDVNCVPQKPGIQDARLRDDGELDPQLRRRVQERRNNLNEYNLPVTPVQLRVTQTESMEQNEPFQCCASCGKDNRIKTKCQSCGCTQKLYRQNASMSESPAFLARPSIHQNETVETPVNKISAKNFYGSPYTKVPMDSISKKETLRWKTNTPNGRIGLSAESKVTKIARIRSTRSEPNDTIILSSDDEDNASTGSTSRIESISPRPADSACSSPVPSSGKVEAALRENSFIDIKFSNPAEADITIPRKARMKDQFGNSVTNTPVKRRKVAQSDGPSEPLPVGFATCESIIVHCRNIRVGTLYRAIVEPVVFCLDIIKVQLEAAPEDSEDGHLELLLSTSELIKCEWCSARKLSVVFFQSKASHCQKLRSQFKMSRQNVLGWYDSNSSNVEEQCIVLILEQTLSIVENAIFEKLLHEIGVKNSIPKFFSKIGFDEANRRLVAFTKHLEETPSCNSTPTDYAARNVNSETRMKLRNSTAQLKFFDDEDEAGDTHSVFVGPIEKLIVYPPPPAKGGISVTNEDLHCLNEGEFLNDVIIDFYLKYLVLEKLREHADRIHIFSSFFYKRLNQRERRNLQDTANLTLQQRRHGRVKTWTRHVDLFQKDFIFVPLNEAAHWFLAVICFPGLEEPVCYPNPFYQAGTLQHASQADDSRTSAIPGDSQACLQGGSSKSTAKKLSNKKQNLASIDTSSGTVESDSSGTRQGHYVGRHALRRNDQEQMETTATLKSLFPQTDSTPKIVNGTTHECKTPLKHIDGLHRIQISYTDSPDDLKKNEEEFIDFSDDQDNLDESSDDGGLADDNFTSEAGKWHLKPTFCKQPCILLMDSLRGPSRSTVVKTLREYLEVEWEVKKGTKRSFSKEVTKGSNPRVPQQNNFSDCGVYVLQYVESFFENPIQSFDLPMNLTDWFPEQRMKTKREEIRNLILTLQELQSKEKKGQRDLSTTQPTPPEGTADHQ
ncbi:sentrin-specific protease 6 isoform X2 [Rana temporaria]|uniref:sentrin-specific protease 6 isoform X2 n=1 Tax=Rana temporaria TaxID=8407 RepID=UPI001AADF257|nr:sentrin-specific protease 6 isoform X2 [Rana temporaria]